MGKRATSKAAFRRLLNEKFPNPHRTSVGQGIGAEGGFKTYGPTKRPYGDYLYAQDRAMFDWEYEQWLAGEHPTTPTTRDEE